jgi:hypothetical protein
MRALEDLWRQEPDLATWTTRAGFKGHIQRADVTGALCGYVELPPGHPWHGDRHGAAHGGITWDSPGGPGSPAPASSAESWLIGFDCGHAWDYQPMMEKIMRALGRQWPMRWARYRPIGYVKANVEALAGQAKGALRKGDPRRRAWCKRQPEDWTATKLPAIDWDAPVIAPPRH